MVSFCPYITQDEFRLVSNELLSYGDKDASERNQDDAVTEAALAEQGVFYLVQLEPDHDPMRFKVGFASRHFRAASCITLLSAFHEGRRNMAL